MRCMYGFWKNDSRVLKHTENITSFTAYDFQDFVYITVKDMQKKLIKNCEEFNDCLKFKNWVKSCDCSRDKFMPVKLAPRL